MLELEGEKQTIYYSLLSELINKKIYILKLWIYVTREVERIKCIS